MNVKAIRRNFCVLIYLISCVLNQRTPKKELLSGVNLDHIRNIARDHTLSAILSAALESVGMATEEDIEKKNLAIRKIMLLDAERASILSELESRKIRYLPLKGVILKELYPYIGLRQMSDNDILFDAAHRHQMKDIMTSRGYSVKTFNKFHHDVYLKKPVYNFEMHVKLFGASESFDFESYFAGVFDEAIKDEGNSYGYSMTDEYYYLYLKAHEYKHWVGYGTGLRSLVDTYVYLKAKQNTLNWSYLEAELEKLNMLSYERMTRELALKIFDPDFAESNINCEKLTQTDIENLDTFFFSGTYGNVVRKVTTDLDKNMQSEESLSKAKARYLWNVLFPSLEYYKVYYPKAYKHKWLIPFVFVKRVFSMVFLRPKTSFSKLGAVLKHKKRDKE